MRSISLMTMYQPQPCVKELTAYITIREVINKKNYRITRTQGNVNFTDLWFDRVEASANNQSNGYVAQHFSLLCDVEKEGDLKKFWESGCGKYSLVALIKIQTGKDKKSITEAAKELLKIRPSSRIFRTLDNADIIMVSFVEKKEEINQLNTALQQIAVIPYYSFYSVGGKLEKEDIKAQWNPTSGKKIPWIYRMNSLMISDNVFLLKNKLNEQKWCDSIRKYLHDEMEKCIHHRNKKWLSYYQAIYQIVNLLGQYEQEEKFKDLFYIFFPALRLFLKQMAAGKKLEEEYRVIGNTAKKYAVSRKIEKSVSSFIDTMESFIYHTGISCINLLNAEGRNGLAYDISIKLCLMYLSTLHAVSKILNDTDYEYCFFLAPMAYSRPITRIFDFGLPPEDRLIKVELARHQFYSPRALEIICAHEVSHYVNFGCRLRKDRGEMYINMAATVLVEELLPDAYKSRIIHKYTLKGEVQKAFTEDWDNRKCDLRQYFRREIGQVVIYKNRSRKHKYYFDDLHTDVCEGIRQILFDSKNQLATFFNILSEPLQRLLISFPNSEPILGSLEEEWKIFNSRIISTAVYGKTAAILRDIKYVLKEIHADCGALLLLRFDPADYLEGYMLSESYVLEPDVINNKLLNRLSIVHILAVENKMTSLNEKSWASQWKEINKNTWGHENAFLFKLKTQVTDYCKSIKINSAIRNGINGMDKTNNMRDPYDLWKVNQSDMEKPVFNMAETQNGNMRFDPFIEWSIIDEEIRYFRKVYKKMSEIIHQDKCKQYLDSLRNLYKHFQVNEPNKESDYSKFFEDLDDLIWMYRESVKCSWKTWEESDTYGN